MPSFRYRAIAASGDVLEGTIEAGTRATVIERLQCDGHFPISAEEIWRSSAWSWLHRDVFPSRRISQRDVQMLTQQVATLLHAGLPLDRSLEILANLPNATARMRTVAERLLKRIQSGGSLADAMAAETNAFPPFLSSMVRAGEAGGALEPVLNRVGDYLEKSQALRETIKSAMVYPIILLIMSLLSVGVLLGFVLPQFAPIFEESNKRLPLSTEVILSIASFLKTYWLVLAAGTAGSWLLVRRQLRSPRQRQMWDAVALRVPLLGDFIAKVEVARFSRTLSTLLSNGVVLLGALQVGRGTIRNSKIGHAIDMVAERVREGKGLAEPIAQTGLFPHLAVHLIHVGEQTGRLEAMLHQVAEIYDREVKRAVERMTVLLVPALTIGLGLIVAGIIMSILVAILSAYDLAI